MNFNAWHFYLIVRAERREIIFPEINQQRQFLKFLINILYRNEYKVQEVIVFFCLPLME